MSFTRFVSIWRSMCLVETPVMRTKSNLGTDKNRRYHISKVMYSRNTKLPFISVTPTILYIYSPIALLKCSVYSIHDNMSKVICIKQDCLLCRETNVATLLVKNNWKSDAMPHFFISMFWICHYYSVLLTFAHKCIKGKIWQAFCNRFRIWFQKHIVIIIPTRFLQDKKDE